MSRRGQKTPRTLMILRVGLTTWVPIALGCLLLGIVPGFGVLFLILAVAAVFMFATSLFVRIGGWLLFHDDPEYRQWIKSGGRPYWDVVPWPFNTDSDETRYSYPVSSAVSVVPSLAELL